MTTNEEDRASALAMNPRDLDTSEIVVAIAAHMTSRGVIENLVEMFPHVGHPPLDAEFDAHMATFAAELNRRVPKGMYALPMTDDHEDLGPLQYMVAPAVVVVPK